MFTSEIQVLSEEELDQVEGGIWQAVVLVLAAYETGKVAGEFLSNF